jgi:hypothetical protein
VNAFERARNYGLTIVFDDLGEWGGAELRSEYDPHRREIRINSRIAAKKEGSQLDEFIELCVGHELYHHREAIGEIERLERHGDREAAADAFARSLLA